MKLVDIIRNDIKKRHDRQKRQTANYATDRIPLSMRHDFTIVNFDSDYVGAALKWENMKFENGKFTGLQYPHSQRINILMLAGNVATYSRKDMGVPTRNNGDGVPERHKYGYYIIYAAR